MILPSIGIEGKGTNKARFAQYDAVFEFNLSITGTTPRFIIAETDAIETFLEIDGAYSADYVFDLFGESKARRTNSNRVDYRLDNQFGVGVFFDEEVTTSGNFPTCMEVTGAIVKANLAGSIAGGRLTYAFFVGSSGIGAFNESCVAGSSSGRRWNNTAIIGVSSSVPINVVNTQIGSATLRRLK